MNNDVVSFPPNASIVHNSNAGAVPSSYLADTFLAIDGTLYNIARIIRQLEVNCALFCITDILHSILIVLYAVEVKNQMLREFLGMDLCEDEEYYIF